MLMYEFASFITGSSRTLVEALTTNDLHVWNLFPQFRFFPFSFQINLQTIIHIYSNRHNTPVFLSPGHLANIFKADKCHQQCIVWTDYIETKDISWLLFLETINEINSQYSTPVYSHYINARLQTMGQTEYCE